MMPSLPVRSGKNTIKLFADEELTFPGFTQTGFYFKIQIISPDPDPAIGLHPTRYWRQEPI